MMRWGLGALVLWSLVFFPLADTGSVPLVLLSVAGMLFIQGAYLGPQPAVFSELFPTAVRYSGASLSLTLATVLRRRHRADRRDHAVRTHRNLEPRDGLHHRRVGDLVAVLARAAGNLPRQPRTPGLSEAPPWTDKLKAPPRSQCLIARPSGGRRVMPRELPPLPGDVEDYRDERWCRDVTRLVQTPIQAEQLRRARRLRRVHDRFAAARSVALRGRVRAARRGDAAQRADRRGGVAGVDAEGRAAAARTRLLRQAGPRAGDVPGAAHDSAFQRGVGAAQGGRAAPARQRARRRFFACCAANGRWAPRTCARSRA